MKHDTKQLISGILLFLFLIAGGTAIFIWFVDIFRQADKSVQASIVAGSVAIISLIFGYWKERSRAIKEAHREKKISIYSSFFDITSHATKNAGKKESDNYFESDEFLELMYDLKKNLLFYGSPKVINSFAAFQLASNDSDGSDPSSSLKRVGKVFLAMREDIGLSNRGLDDLSIHQININEDVNKYR